MTVSVPDAPLPERIQQLLTGSHSSTQHADRPSACSWGRMGSGLQLLYKRLDSRALLTAPSQKLSFRRESENVLHRLAHRQNLLRSISRTGTVEPPHGPTAAVAPWPSYVDDPPTMGSFGDRIELLSRTRTNKNFDCVMAVVCVVWGASVLCVRAYCV